MKEKTMYEDSAIRYAEITEGLRNALKKLCPECEQALSEMMTEGMDLLGEMERVINEKNEFNRVMFNFAPVGLTIFNDNCNFIDCNDAVLKMCGVTKQYYLKHFFDLSPEFQNDGSKSREKQLDYMKRTLNGEKIIMEWLHCTPNGELIPCEISLIRTRRGEGYVGLGYIYDLRNVKKIEMALSEAEKLTRSVMEANPISYIMYNDALDAIDCNSTAMRVFGCPDKQFLLENYWGRFSPVYQPDGRKSFEKAHTMKDRAFAEGKAVFEWDHRSLEGEAIPVESTLTPMVSNGKKYFISYKYDLRSIRKMEESIRYLETEAEKVYYYALTGIFNRRYFDENLNRLTKSLSRSDGLLSVMMLDIDFFKKYNDTYGHNEGDKCLKIVAEALAQTIPRADDFVARYGGEEFAVVLPNTSEKGARKVAERLLESIRDCNILHEQSDAAPYVTISIGVTTGQIDHTQIGENFIKRADEMLYASKQNGRNKYTFGAL